MLNILPGEKSTDIQEIIDDWWLNLSNNQSTTVYLSTMVVEKNDTWEDTWETSLQKISQNHRLFMYIVGINSVYMYVSGVNIPVPATNLQFTV